MAREKLGPTYYSCAKKADNILHLNELIVDFLPNSKAPGVIK
jgi:hypothetical protein